MSLPFFLYKLSQKKAETFFLDQSQSRAKTQTMARNHTHSDKVQNMFVIVNNVPFAIFPWEINRAQRMVSFFVEVEKQQYFDHLQLSKALLKLLPFQTCLLLFEKQNSKGIRKVYIIFICETDPNKCSVRAMFERAQKEVLADGMKLYDRYINLFSLFCMWKP